MKNSTKKERIKSAGLRLVYITPIFMVILLSIFGYLYFFGENHPSYRRFITSVENQLGQLKSSDDESAANVAALKSVKERVAMLESVAAMRKQMLLELTEELDREKKNRELLNSELSSKEVEIARLQEELENAQTNALEFEAEIENRIVQIRKLEGQLLNLKLETSSPETHLGPLSSRNVKLRADIEELKGMKDLVAGLKNELAERDQTISSLKKRLSDIATELDQEKLSKELISSEDQDESPKPSNIIDYVLKKKAK